MTLAPAGIAWEDRASRFLDSLVDSNIDYMDAQIAIETLIHAGLHDEITVTFDLDGRTIHWHWMPPLTRGLSSLDVLTTVEQTGLIRVLIVRFSTRRPFL